MSKQVDLSDRFLDTSKLCLRNDKNAVIKAPFLSVKSTRWITLFVFSKKLGINQDVRYEFNAENDIIYKSDFEAYNE